MLCLSAAGLLAALPLASFTLAWTHSIEKIRWEEDWQLEAHQLRISSARIRGSGAGMEIPAGAVLHNGAWHYRPALHTVPQLNLQHSPFTDGYELCPPDASCRPLADWLPGLPDVAVITAQPCAGNSPVK